MDIQSWPASRRALHYGTEAEKFRRMADAEPVGRVREQLLSVARQYQELAESLKADRPRL
jgi:hypothetical protein